LRRFHFDQAALSAPIIEAVNHLPTPTYGVWRKSLAVTGSSGTTRTFECNCVVIRPDPCLDGSPIFLPMTTLRDIHIHLSLAARQWWFEVPSVELLPLHQFAKKCRNASHVFAVVKLPEEIWLPGETESTSTHSLPH
jgi:hypothetical protein